MKLNKAISLSTIFMICLLAGFGWFEDSHARTDGVAPVLRNYAKVKAEASGLVSTISQSDQSEYDRFGGWKGKSFEGTGFFRTEHDGKRWWLVTPEGNAFISFGVNHYHAGWWTQDYNREHWVRAFGAKKPWDAAWQRGFRKAALSDMRRLGINTLGIHTDAPMLTNGATGAAMPYVRRYEPIVLSHYRNPTADTYVDIFASAFKTQCDAAAREMAEPYANDPMILGYCMADVPAMTDNDAEWHKSTTWPRRLRNLGGDAPGKRAYVETMRNRYTDIAGFNKTYASRFASWEQLLASENWRSGAAPANKGEAADNDAFLLRCVDRYYAVAKAALRRVDANHLFFGDKISANTNTLESIITITSRYTDVINVQYYARWADQKALLDRLSPQVNQPFLNGDSTYSVPSEMLPNPYGPHARDQAQRAEWVREFAENAIARPDFVGWHMCGIIDTPKTMVGKAQNQHMGLMTPKGEFYPEMEEVIQDISARLYRIALGK